MAHEMLVTVTEWAAPLIELMALALITIGTVEAFFNGLRVMLNPSSSQTVMSATWLRYSRWLVGGLTFQLAADIIETSVAPDWNDIGRLAAVALIRTFLNYFLERDQREFRERQQEAVAGFEQGEPRHAG